MQLSGLIPDQPVHATLPDCRPLDVSLTLGTWNLQHRKHGLAMIVWDNLRCIPASTFYHRSNISKNETFTAYTTQSGKPSLNIPYSTSDPCILPRFFFDFFPFSDPDFPAKASRYGAYDSEADEWSSPPCTGEWVDPDTGEQEQRDFEWQNYV